MGQGCHQGILLTHRILQCEYTSSFHSTETGSGFVTRPGIDEGLQLTSKEEAR